MTFHHSTLVKGKEIFPTVRHIQYRGSNFELGRQLAEVSIANHGDSLEKHRVVDPLYARAQQEYLRRSWPALWERARGAASAFGADAEDDRYDFSVLWYNVDLPLRPGCSNAFYPPHRSSDGHAYLSRNYEFSTGTLADVAGIPGGSVEQLVVEDDPPADPGRDGHRPGSLQGRRERRLEPGRSVDLLPLRPKPPVGGRQPMGIAPTRALLRQARQDLSGFPAERAALGLPAGR